VSKVDALKKEFEQVDGDIQRHAAKLQKPLYAKRAETVKDVPQFWYKAMSNCPHLAAYVDDKDQDLLQKLVSINVEQDEQDPRSATVTFEFGDNEYLKSNTLVKKFTVKADAAPLGSDEGEWVEDVTPHKTEIEWTSDEKNLAKQLPLSKPGEEDFQPGSFFSSFFDAIDEQVTNALGDAMVNTFFPNAISFYTGDLVGFEDFEGMDDYDSEDEDDEEDDEEIDLEEEEKRPTKKAKSKK